MPELGDGEGDILTAKKAEELLYEIMTKEERDEFDEKHDLDFSYAAKGIARFRVNYFMQREGIAAAFRPILEHVRTLEELGMPPALQKVTQFNNGLVLLTGAVGTGKSTTLAAIIENINQDKSKHIITIEDPIEFVYKNKKSIIDQREIGHHTESFKSALRAALRENADIILLGEMRDLETIALAITAAETGSLVLGTLHTSGASKTVNRLIDVFPPDQQSQIRAQISESLKAIVWQQLVKKKDGGRVAAMEIMFKNPAVANLIRKENTNQIDSIMETGIDQGMQTMQMHLETLVQQGVITKEEADSRTPKDKQIN